MDVKLLKNMMTLNETQLYNLMSNFLRNNYKRVIETQHYLYAVGDIPIMLIAHLDIAHTKPPTLTYMFHDQEKGVIWSPQGLGADDRAGVYAIITLIKKGYRPSVVFTCGEEVGGVGATAIIKAFKAPVTNINCIIELDRQGYDDCVFYNCANVDYQAYIEKFDFKVANGTFTDISIICPCWGIAGTNLSIGYLFEHTEQEFLVLNWLQRTIDKVEQMLQNPPEKQMKYISKSHVSHLDDSSEVEECIRCGAKYLRSEMVPIMCDNEFDVRYGCIECVAQDLINLDWCDYCGEAYLHQEGDRSHACPRHKLNKGSL